VSWATWRTGKQRNPGRPFILWGKKRKWCAKRKIVADPATMGMARIFERDYTMQVHWHDRVKRQPGTHRVRAKAEAQSKKRPPGKVSKSDMSHAMSKQWSFLNRSSSAIKHSRHEHKPVEIAEVPRWERKEAGKERGFHIRLHHKRQR